MLRYSLLFIYVIVNILLFLLNWNLFTTTSEFDLGFTTLSTIPFFILQIFGGVIIVMLTIANSIRNLSKEAVISKLQKKNSLLQKETELAPVKQ